MTKNIKATFGILIFLMGIMMFPAILLIPFGVIILGGYFHHRGYRIKPREGFIDG